MVNERLGMRRVQLRDAACEDETRPRDQRGASAVEFALILPVFVVIVFGIISFGIIFAQELALSNVAREAARFGVVEGRTCGDISTLIEDNANTIAMDGADVTVDIQRGQAVDSTTSPCGDDANIPCDSSVANDSLFVTVQYDSELVVPLLFATPTFILEGNGVFRCEFS